MSSFIGFVHRLYMSLNPPGSTPSAESRPLRFGILGVAAIAPAAIIVPVKNHPETILYAVASRDKTRATAFAQKHGILRVYGGPHGYLELIDDPEVDVVYNPLPNGLHYEWTMRALAAGKHVLLEKPSAATADETRQMFDLAEKKGLVLLEAVHYRFHPSIQRVKAIIDSKELGALKHISASLATPQGTVKPDDIRLNHALAGGNLMGMGFYNLSVIRYLSSSNPTSIISADHTLYIPPSSSPSFKPNIDLGTTATLALPDDATASMESDYAMPYKYYGLIPPMPKMSVTVTLEGGEIELYNFLLPTLYHYIKVTSKDADNREKSRIEKVYTFADGKMEGKGEAWWTTYRFQLEALVDRVKGRTPQTWVEREDSIANMHWIEQIYAKTGLSSRPKSEFVLPESHA